MKEKKLTSFILILMTALPAVIYAQNQSAYLIPRQIYVGDPAALVLPLPAAAQNSNDIILVNNDIYPPDNFPSHENIDFHRIILERRVSGSRLIIEFTAFVPGITMLPAIEIGGEIFTGLSVTVNSIIDGRSDRTLSGIASTLAMPGTAFMIYGSMAALVIILTASIWFFVKGRTILRDLREKWKRFRLFSGVRKTEKTLRKAVLKGAEKRAALDILSEETRNFLSVLTDRNCLSMTAREFETLQIMPKAQTDTLENNSFLQDELASVRFDDFFYRCDKYRFSGIDTEEKEILELLDDLLEYTDILERARKNDKQTEVKAA